MNAPSFPAAQCSPPRVSVVIPFYNGGDRLGATLQRVYAQTFTDFEVIVVDDGSTQVEAGKLARLAAAFPIATLRQANSGPAAARNTGLRAARGEIVALLDADDLWEPQKLGLQVGAFEGDPDLTVCVHDSSTVDARGNTVSLNRFSRLGETTGEFARAVLWNQVHSITSSLACRKSAAAEIAGMNAQLRFREDHAFLIDLMAHGKLARLDQVLSSRVIHAESYSHSSRSDYVARKRYWDEKFFSHVAGRFDRETLQRAREAALEHTAVNDVIMGRRGRAAWSMLEALVRGNSGLRPLKVLAAAAVSVFRPSLLDRKDPTLAQRRQA